VRLYDHDHDLLAESAPVTIHIDDHGHEEPVLTISGVAGHYHQGNTIALTVTVEPEPHEDDRIVWEWKWPGGEWTPILGASGDTFSAIAEQALDGVQVRATLIPADEDDEPVVSAAVTIDVDDHGDPAHQVVTVAGATSYAAGDTVNLTAVVSPSTVLRAFQWQRRSAGEEEWQVVAGQTGATLGFMAMLADDGSEYRVAALRPDGSIAYGPSAAVSLAIGPMAVAEPELALSVASGDELAMTLKLPPGVSYQLEFSETLEEGSWENVGEPFTGGVEPISLTLPKTGDRGFYRLIVVEDS